MAKNELGFFNPHSEESNLVGIVPQTREEQKAIINGLNSPDHKLSDYINLQLNIVNFYIERTEYTNEDNEVREGFRTILIDAAGDTYTTGSNGVVNALRTILAFCGTPDTWEGGLTVRVKEINRGNMRVLTLELV